MKVSLFVTVSAAFLFSWLGLTFVREVPKDNYPVLGKGSLPLSAKAAPGPGEDRDLAVTEEPEAGDSELVVVE